MKATVICESSFGNTRAIAEAIAEALDAEVLSAGDPIELEEVDLLVVGAPTHVHGIPGERSRKARSTREAPMGPACATGWTTSRTDTAALRRSTRASTSRRS